MKIFKKILFALTVLIVAFHSKLKAQKQYYLLYSDATLNHNFNDTCEAKIIKENNTLILYSGNNIDT